MLRPLCRPPAASAANVEDEYRRPLADHFEQLSRGVAVTGESGKIYPDVLTIIRDIRRASAKIARVAGTADRER